MNLKESQVKAYGRFWRKERKGKMMQLHCNIKKQKKDCLKCVALIHSKQNVPSKMDQDRNEQHPEVLRPDTGSLRKRPNNSTLECVS